MSNAIIIGASGHIAQATIAQLAPEHTIFGVSQNPIPDPLESLLDSPHQWLQTQYDEEAVLNIGERLNQTLTSVDKIIITHGKLHSAEYMPEKKLDALTWQQLQEATFVNAFLPTLWLKALAPLIQRSVGCKIVVFSARVGSISDNHLGGWYSYRASKSMLNMLLKTATIELTRRNKNLKLLSFHPGTTKTPLSEPFQKNVAQGKLFTPEFVAAQLINILSTCPIDGELSFIDWNNKTIDW